MSRSPSQVPTFSPLFWGRILLLKLTTAKKVGTLILSSLLEDLEKKFGLLLFRKRSVGSETDAESLGVGGIDRQDVTLDGVKVIGSQLYPNNDGIEPDSSVPRRDPSDSGSAVQVMDALKVCLVRYELGCNSPFFFVRRELEATVSYPKYPNIIH